MERRDINGNLDEIKNIELTIKDLQLLMNLFDPNGGVYEINEKMSNWLLKILSIYH